MGELTREEALEELGRLERSFLSKVPEGFDTVTERILDLIKGARAGVNGIYDEGFYLAKDLSLADGCENEGYLYCWQRIHAHLEECGVSVKHFL